MNLKSLQSVAETYLAMLRPKAAASVSKPKWVPASITEENVAAFVQAVTEARKANQSVVEFNGKKYAIKSIKEETSEEADQGTAKKLQDVSTANALKQPSDEVPDEVKEEDEEEIKKANHDEKEAEADEMPELDEPKLSEEEHEDEEDSDKKDDEEDDNGDDEVEAEVEVEEELVGNQHKLDMDKDGEIDAEDLKKLRGESTEMNESESPEWITHPNNGTLHLRRAVKSKLHGHVYPKGTDQDDWRADHPTNPKEHPAAVARVKAKGRTYGRPMNGMDTYVPKYNESTQLTGEQVMSSVAATYAAMVNENVAGDPHAATLSSKANSASALAHASDSETHHEDARDAHHAAAEHYRVYAHNHHDPLVRSAAKIHHEFHRSMSNHHMLNLVSSDMDKEAHDMAAKLYGKKSVEEGTAADAEAGPEVMDPATQKMKDAHDDETEITDKLPSKAQDGSDDVKSADKPAAANKSAALPKVAIVDAPTKLGESAIDEVSSDNAQHALSGEDERKKHAAYMKKAHGVTTKYHGDDEVSYHGPKANVKKAIINHYGHNGRADAKELHPHLFKESVEVNEGAYSSEFQHPMNSKVPVITAPVTTNESTENMNNNTTIKSVGEAYIQMNEDVHSSEFQHPMNSKKGHLERLAHHATLSKHHASFIDNNKGIPYDVHFKKADHHKAYADDHAKAAIEHGASPDEILKHGKGVIQWFKHPKWGT